MEHRPLGRTGVRVPSLCLGTMTFGLQSDEATSFAIMDGAYEAGIDFLDTADVYPLGGGFETSGRTEEVIGRWMKERGLRDKLFVATKVMGRMSPAKNDGGLSRHHIVRGVEDSLRRLQTDVIDLYQCHHFDPHTPIDETLRAFDDLVRQGKVRYVGCSNYPAFRLGKALSESARLGLARFETIQPRYNILYREIETEVLPLARQEQLGVLVYNPIAGGMLSGKYKPNQEPEEGTRFTLGKAGQMYQWRYWNEAMIAACEQLAEATKERDLALPTVAVAWVLQQPGVTSSIIGASKPEQLKATVAGAELKLDPELSQLCDEIWWKLPRRPVIEGYR